MFPLRRVLVPTDFSACSGRALDQAVAFAERSHARIYLLHVINRGAQECIADYCLSPEIPRKIENESIVSTDENLKKEIEKASKTAGAVIVPVMRKGYPDEEILKEARERNIDMIVLASIGKAGLSRHLIGGVTERVLKGAPCPVLLVRS